MSLRVVSCEEHKLSWLHEDDRFDDGAWDGEPGMIIPMRLLCPHGEHWTAATVGYRVAECQALNALGSKLEDSWED